MERTREPLCLTGSPRNWNQSVTYSSFSTYHHPSLEERSQSVPRAEGGPRMCRNDEEIFHLRMLLYEFKVMTKIFTRKLGTKTSLDHSSFITVLILFLKEFNVS